MDEMLKTILEIHKQAEAKVEQAEEYRREQLASLNKKKAEIISDETQKAKESAVRRSNRLKSENEKIIDELKAKNKSIINNMDNLYSQKKDLWVNDIFNKITK